MKGLIDAVIEALKGVFGAPEPEPIPVRVKDRRLKPRR